MTPSERRALITAEIVERTGIDEAMISQLVRRFYAKVREDELLGPIFAAHITDWEPHLERMCAFWSSVALLTGRYHGRPMEKHLPLPVDGQHFDRWLDLFGQTARELCPEVAAEHFIERAPASCCARTGEGRLPAQSRQAQPQRALQTSIQPGPQHREAWRVHPDAT
jgi:hemoglobin